MSNASREEMAVIKRPNWTREAGKFAIRIAIVFYPFFESLMTRRNVRRRLADRLTCPRFGTISHRTRQVCTCFICEREREAASKKKKLDVPGHLLLLTQTPAMKSEISRFLLVHRRHLTPL